MKVNHILKKNHYIERSFDKIKIEDLEILKKYLNTHKPQVSEN